jgi:ribosome-associated protein
MIHISADIKIAESEIHEEFIRASGPGGQNVNKVASAVKIRFHVAESPSLPDHVRDRLMRIADRRITADGVLIIDARRFRTQNQNRRDAINRLVDLIRKAAEKPKPRLKTTPSPAAKEARLDEKRRHSRNKRTREAVPPHEE